MTTTVVLLTMYTSPDSTSSSYYVVVFCFIFILQKSMQTLYHQDHGAEKNSDGVKVGEKDDHQELWFLSGLDTIWLPQQK